MPESRTAGILLFTLTALSLLFTACTGTRKIKTGDDAFASGQYWRAAELYQAELEKTRNPEQLHYKSFQIAQAYEKMNEPDNASQWYEQAMGHKKDDVLTKLRYAYSLKNTGRYNQAAVTFEQISEDLNEPGRFRNELISLRNAEQWVAAAADNEYKIAKAPFNTREADYGTTIDSTGQLYITQDYNSASNSRYLWTGRSHSRINKVDSNATSSIMLQSFVNEKDINTGLLQFSSDFTQLAFCKCTGPEERDKTCKIYYSRRNGDVWQDPLPVEFTIDSVNYLSPAFSHDGKTLFFTCEDPVLQTGFDVYYSILKGNSWSAPVILPGNINSAFNEKYVTVHQDTLYISSDNTIGMGGLDIYKTYMLNSRWAPLQNLKAPINSAYDDFYLIVSNNTPEADNILQRGFISSNRPGGAGHDDIYKFTKKRLTPVSPVDTPVIADNYHHFRLRVYVKGYKIVDGFESQDPNDMLLLDSALVTIAQAGKPTQSIYTNRIGLATTELEISSDLRIIAAHEGYLKTPINVPKEHLKIDSAKTIQELTLIINLHPLIFDQEFVISDIYYDYDKANIRNDAEPALHKLADLLSLNNEYRILIGSHTDCRGTDTYNQSLSEARARSVVDWLIGRGIDQARLQSRGYGEKVPAAKCACDDCTETEHQLNRRTTFRLIR